MKTDPLKIPVVYYHSVGPEKTDWIRNYLTVSLENFESQLKYLAKKYQIINLKEYWEIINKKQTLVKNPLVITFDDGFLDNWIWAFPLLKKYNIKATIFVSPEFIDKNQTIRPNLDDYWEGKASIQEITQWGYLSWQELQLMESSGLIDIQSHTMSHTKYAISDKIIGFHHPGSDSLYTIGNMFPERKPYHITDKKFNVLLPYGYPIFEEASSVIARKIKINPEFIDECLSLSKNADFKKYQYNVFYSKILPLYNSYKQKDNLIVAKENDEEYINRLNYEIVESKVQIEKNLNKIVEFLCWPHGDTNQTAYQLAIDSGYLMTTKGKASWLKDSDYSVIPVRMGMDYSSNFKRMKTHVKLKSLANKFPYILFGKFYKFLKGYKA